MGRKMWSGGGPRPRWAREIADDHTWQKTRYSEPEATIPTPQPGDVVIKPGFDSATMKQLFRVETWQTHALLDGPFHHIRQALDAALEVGVTARLSVWIDFSEDPQA